MTINLNSVGMEKGRQYETIITTINPDGTKKDIIELLNDRNKLLLKYDRKQIDDLYYAVCNYKDYYQVEEKGALGECEKIIGYIYDTNDTDEFVEQIPYPETKNGDCRPPKCPIPPKHSLPDTNPAARYPFL